MDWLRNFTVKLKLGTSFLTYLLCSLIFSIPLSIFLQVFLEEVHKRYILSNTLKSHLNFLDKLMYSTLFIRFIDFIPLIIIILFFFIFFNLFYKDKIHSVINYLKDDSFEDLKERNELSSLAFEIMEEKEKLKFDNHVKLRNLNEVSKKMDTVFHEIKNPLAVLKGDIELLRVHYKGKDEKILKILARMDRSEKRMEEYIRNIKVSRNIMDLKADMEPVSLENFIEGLKKELEFFSKNISFSSLLNDLSGRISLDMKLFTEGFLNIVKNSDTHAKENIDISIYEEISGKSAFIVVQIEDDGPGFSKDAMTSYNKAYFSENPLVGNMGLGLYITDEIMKKQNIKMVLENNSGAVTKLFIEKC